MFHTLGGSAAFGDPQLKNDHRWLDTELRRELVHGRGAAGRSVGGLGRPDGGAVWKAHAARIAAGAADASREHRYARLHRYYRTTFARDHPDPHRGVKEHTLVTPRGPRPVRRGPRRPPQILKVLTQWADVYQQDHPQPRTGAIGLLWSIVRAWRAAATPARERAQVDFLDVQPLVTLLCVHVHVAELATADAAGEGLLPTLVSRVLRGALLSTLALYQRTRFFNETRVQHLSDDDLEYTHALTQSDRERRREVYDLLDQSPEHEEDLEAVLDLLRDACAIGLYACADYKEFNTARGVGTSTQCFLSEGLNQRLGELRTPANVTSVTDAELKARRDRRWHVYRLLRLLDLTLARLRLYLRFDQTGRDVVAGRRLQTVAAIVDLTDHRRPPVRLTDLGLRLGEAAARTTSDVDLVRLVRHTLRDEDFPRYAEAELAAARRRGRKRALVPLPR